MKKASVHKSSEELQPEYDLAKLGKGVRGKYFARAAAGTNLVLIEPETGPRPQEIGGLGGGAPFS